MKKYVAQINYSMVACLNNNNNNNFISYLMEDDDDDDDDDEDNFLIAAVAAVASQEEVARASFHIRNRLEWDHHIAQLEQEGPQAFHPL